MRLAALVVAAMATSAPLGCTALETNLQDGEVAYHATARQNFESGEKAMAEKRYEEAIRFFDHTKNKYPYSKYAVLAELRTADAHFAREKWLEAADAYRIFVRFHPTHERVPYAMFRVALAHSREIDEEVWWMPPVVQKDQGAAREAIRSLDEFLARFPADANADEARRLRSVARARLAATDLYAAAFYEKRRKWQGALWRYERVANEYPDTRDAPPALLRAARIASERLNDKDAAARLFERLVQQHAASPEAAEARRELERAGRTSPTSG